MKTFTDKAFRHSAIALGGIALIILLAFSGFVGLYGEILGLLFLFSGCFAILGSVNSIKSLKEPNTRPKILAMAVEFCDRDFVWAHDHSECAGYFKGIRMTFSKITND